MSVPLSRAPQLLVLFPTAKVIASAKQGQPRYNGFHLACSHSWCHNHTWLSSNSQYSRAICSTWPADQIQALNQCSKVDTPVDGRKLFAKRWQRHRHTESASIRRAGTRQTGCLFVLLNLVGNSIKSELLPADYYQRCLQDWAMQELQKVFKHFFITR